MDVEPWTAGASGYVEAHPDGDPVVPVDVEVASPAALLRREPRRVGFHVLIVSRQEDTEAHVGDDCPLAVDVEAYGLLASDVGVGGVDYVLLGEHIVHDSVADVVVSGPDSAAEFAAVVVIGEREAVGHLAFKVRIAIAYCSDRLVAVGVQAPESRAGYAHLVAEPHACSGGWIVA